jgi:hypothetical protein
MLARRCLVDDCDQTATAAVSVWAELATGDDGNIERREVALARDTIQSHVWPASAGRSGGCPSCDSSTPAHL